MKKIKVISLVIGALFLAVCFGYIVFIRTPNVEDSSPSADEALSIKAENISAVQLNTARIKEKRSFQRLADAMENIMVVENKTDPVQRTDDYDVVSLIYDDGTKDIFYFFSQDNAWYLETSDGNQYKNADFITDYIERVDVMETKKVQIQRPSAWQLELARETKIFDTSFFLKELVYYDINERGMTKEDAIADARKSMQADRTLYQYALENGYGLTEQETQQLLREEIEEATLADNYDEVSALYQEQGLSLEAYMEKRKENIVMHNTISKLYHAKYEEFRHGNDSIGAHVCENVTEYWNTFVLEEVQPRMANYDFSEFQRELDAAESDIK